MSQQDRSQAAADRPGGTGPDGLRIVQLANLVSPTSGGIRTTLDRLRAGYGARGHRTVLVVPGRHSGREDTPDGLVVRVGAPRIPLSGGYRMIVDLPEVRRLLDDLAPDRVEVHDRFTLRGIGTWARDRGIPSIAVVHERLDRLAAMRAPWLLRPGHLARQDNAAFASRFDTVVSPSRWAAQEFRRVGAANVEVVGWGVDLVRFRPARRNPDLRRRLLGGQEVLVGMVCRLSPEKRPGSAVAALRALRARGVDARLVVAGTGQSEAAMRREAAGLPVTFLGHVASRDEVADLLASADVAICPGPIETFGLAALEALASGTPVVSSGSGAIAELLAPPFGRSAYNHGPPMAAAAMALLDAGSEARTAARAAAEAHPWERAINRMLALHELAAPAVPPAPRPPAAGATGWPARSRTTRRAPTG